MPKTKRTPAPTDDDYKPPFCKLTNGELRRLTEQNERALAELCGLIEKRYSTPRPARKAARKTQDKPELSVKVDTWYVTRIGFMAIVDHFDGQGGAPFVGYAYGPDGAVKLRWSRTGRRSLTREDSYDLVQVKDTQAKPRLWEREADAKFKAEPRKRRKAKALEVNGSLGFSIEADNWYMARDGSRAVVTAYKPCFVRPFVGAVYTESGYHRTSWYANGRRFSEGLSDFDIVRLPELPAEPPRLGHPYEKAEAKPRKRKAKALKLVVGGWYRTRDGKKAQVTGAADEGSGTHYPFSGIVYFSNSVLRASWRADGSYGIGTGGWDLVKHLRGDHSHNPR